MMKAWGWRYGIWFGAGKQSEKTPLVSATWLHTFLPPYRRGSGVAFGLGHYSARVGLYKTVGHFEPDEYDINLDDAEEEIIVAGFNREIEPDIEKLEKVWDGASKTPQSSEATERPEPESEPAPSTS